MSTAADAARVLLALAEEGCAFAAAGRLEDLAGQQGAWEAAVTALRAHGEPTREVQALLDRALALQGEQAAILVAARSQVAVELGRLRRTRTGARGYAGTTGLPGASHGVEAAA